MTDQTKDERVKHQILEAALGLFAKWGLFKTTMEDIAKAAAKGKSTLYYYFKNKDEIFIDLAIYEFRAILSKAQEAIAQQTTAEDKLRAYILCTIEEVQQRATVYQVVFSELSNIETIITRLRKVFYKEDQAVISKILSDGVESGELTPLDSLEIADLSRLISLSIKGFLAEYAAENDFSGAKKMINRSIPIFMHGLKR